MEIREIIRLADWYEGEADELTNAYISLTSALQHNAQQSGQQPVTGQLNALLTLLNEMPVEQLSTLQFRVLDHFDVSGLLGKPGAKWIDQIVKTATYDPATTYQQAQKALTSLENARQQLMAFKNASTAIGIEDQHFEPDEKRFLINVIFQGNASISNVRDWKKTASDWEQIVAGLAAAIGERPEDTTVVGVSNGSIILTLGATAALTKLLATISKHITGIAHDILSVRLMAEELRQKKMTTANMEKEFSQLEANKRADGIKLISESVDAALPDIAPEDRTKLNKSIEKALAFGEAGGEVDFVIPEVDQSSDEDEDAVAEELLAIRNLVEDQQRTRQEVKRLESYGE